MKKSQKFLTLIGLLLVGSLSADVVGTKIARLELADGRILKNVTIVSMGSTSVMAKWDGGRGAIRKSDLPESVQAEFPAADNETEGPAYNVVTTPSTDYSQPAPISRPPELDESPYPEAPQITEATGRIQTISGQVFISTKGGTNIKLGGVQVWVYSEVDYIQQSKWMEEGPLKLYSSHMKRIDFFSAHKMHGEAVEEFTLAFEVRQAAFKAMRKPDNVTVTDADGRFTLKHRVGGNYYLMCAAKRELGDDTEYYRWAVRSGEITDPSSVMLHNANLQNH